MPTTRPGYIWSGTEWVSIGQEAVVAPVSYQASAPSSPSTGDIWIDSNDDVPGIDTSQFLRWRKTAAGGETSVSGTDDTGLTLTYTPNYEQVYLNGVLLVRGQDYTATNGTSITGLTALAANDVVEVFGVVARVVGDVYTQAQTNSLLDAKSNVSTTGLILLNDITGNTSSTTFTTAASVSFNNIFSSTYKNYRVLFEVSGSTAAATFLFRFRENTTDKTTDYFIRNFRLTGSPSLIPVAFNSQPNQTISENLNNSIATVGSIEIMRVSATTGFAFSIAYEGANEVFYQHTKNVAMTNFNGFTVYPSTGTMTGTIKVYGYK